MDENKLEADLQNKNLNAPRLSPKLIDDAILTEQYYQFPGTVCTVCCLTLQNGFNVIGHSAPASPENFNLEIGKKIARGKAREQIWSLEGYLLKQHLSEQNGKVKND